MIISISGKKGSGKDLAGRMIRKMLGKQWEIHKWAGSLKDLVESQYPYSFSINKWEKNRKNYREEYVPVLGMSRRELLIEVGDERRSHHVNYFSGILISKYWNRCNGGENPKFIITDTRYENEVNTVKTFEGITIRIDRDTKPESTERGCSIAEHPSENEFKKVEHDYTINNNSSKRQLKKKLKEILVKEGLLT